MIHTKRHIKFDPYKASLGPSWFTLSRDVGMWKEPWQLCIEPAAFQDVIQHELEKEQKAGRGLNVRTLMLGGKVVSTVGRLAW